MSDPRDEAAKLIPVIERAQKAEQRLRFCYDALSKVVSAFDSFVDSDTVEPLVVAIKDARNALFALERTVGPKEE